MRAFSLLKAEAAFNHVRSELCELGLLSAGKYLDKIELVLTALPSILGEAGYVFDRHVPFFARMVGYEEGVIYLPRNIPHTKYLPGGTLIDVVRHEFAHAWAWLDPIFISRPWFRKTFGGKYQDTHYFESNVYTTFKKMARHSDSTPDGEWHFRHYGFSRYFYSEYAMKAIYEDFAETFMCFLRYRKSLGRFKHRPGLYAKLRAVEAAAQEKAKTLML